MILVVEARHRVVRLRLEPRAGDPPLGGAASTGSRAPAMRLLTSAVMNTVLPERERPVTPRRSRPPAK